MMLPGVAAAWAVVGPRLEDTPAPEDVRPGWWAIAMVVGLVVVTVLLWFSMRKQITKIDFDEDASGEPDAGRDAGRDAGPDSGLGDTPSNGSRPQL